MISDNTYSFIGGSADLFSSTKTYTYNGGDFSSTNYTGKNIYYGVREHAMASLSNGIASIGLRPYASTFLVFSDYLRPNIRMAALAKIQTLFIFTHDSIAVGEDGPTHQPVETISSLRLIPNLYVFRPADAMEVVMCYLKALSLKESPSALLFTRQKLPLLEKEEGFNPHDIFKGAYIVRNKEVLDKVIIATGSEVSLAVEVSKVLEEKGEKYRVVSMPCMEAFLEQSKEYQESIIPSLAKVVTLEMGSTLVWGKFAGKDGLSIGIDTFGESAPASKLLEKFGFTADRVAERILSNN